MIDAYIKLCGTASLRQAQLVEIGIPSHQVRVWSELLGIGGPKGKMPKSTWRLYTPADVFMLSVMRVLKKNLNFAFSGKEKCISRLSEIPSLHTALSSIFDEFDAYIVSDFSTFYEVSSDPDAMYFAISRSDLSLSIPVKKHILAMLRASARSPNEKQSYLGLTLLKRFHTNSPNLLSTRSSHQRATPYGRVKPG